ncbi:methyltransferase FkbM [Burkholderia ubonensis]|uniref:Methyltransferase FkbM n=1 Tax=Burkholderia ubonensis TaxID=101571 RepID=A0AB73FX12_9BURK|nr:FkbM family methyltransferase [Burkholderia ubonensis]KVC74413.1 methyltransferase FkbM [Burkholderia ubonensis]KVD18123.1 methyltransferase FkbM [Burkholderia ubonensis]KVG74788.1 methyltransferase FkbM [Burkholderia ubonensis]KVH17274.1 methyltransferase FkbM [Burkholderia ubonensis]KVH48526.1 methyltransferase FkbM [Burkholderia ubonensis]
MKISYILASTKHGTLIVNRNDENHSEEYGTYGVGWNILENGSFYNDDIELLNSILELKKRELNGKRPVVAIDCGANIGVHTIEFARALGNAGSVISIEAQRSVYYALCGNIAINNCFNVDARNVAVGGESGSLRIPFVDYHKKSSFGSLELVRSAGNENIGQQIDYDTGYDVPLITIDSLNQPDVDFIKIDVEGMEEAVIAGALGTLSASGPIMFIEKIKSNLGSMYQTLGDLKYDIHDIGPNILAVSRNDPISREIRKSIEGQRRLSAASDV